MQWIFQQSLLWSLFFHGGPPDMMQEMGSKRKEKYVILKKVIRWQVTF